MEVDNAGTVRRRSRSRYHQYLEHLTGDKLSLSRRQARRLARTARRMDKKGRREARLLRRSWLYPGATSPSCAWAEKRSIPALFDTDLQRMTVQFMQAAWRAYCGGKTDRPRRRMDFYKLMAGPLVDRWCTRRSGFIVLRCFGRLLVEAQMALSLIRQQNTGTFDIFGANRGGLRTGAVSVVVSSSVWRMGVNLTLPDLLRSITTNTGLLMTELLCSYDNVLVSPLHKSHGIPASTHPVWSNTHPVWCRYLHKSEVYRTTTAVQEDPSTDIRETDIRETVCPRLALVKRVWSIEYRHGRFRNRTGSSKSGSEWSPVITSVPGPFWADKVQSTSVSPGRSADLAARVRQTMYGQPQ